MNVVSKGQSSRGEPAPKLSAVALATVNTRNFPARMPLDWTGIAGNTADLPTTTELDKGNSRVRPWQHPARNNAAAKHLR